MRDSVKFMWRVAYRAWQRQSTRGSEGNTYARCAKCGEYLVSILEQKNSKGGWYPVQRIITTKGGNKTIDNCIILCPKCFEFVSKTNAVIPYEILPFIDG